MSADTAGDLTVGRSTADKVSARRRRRLLTVLAGFLVVVTVTVTEIAATYQPITYGRTGPSITGQVRVRAVNDFADMPGQQYIPPQPAATGALIVGLDNTGPQAVTVESVSLSGQPWPPVLASAGPATYVRLAGANPVVTAASPRIAGAVLRPGEWVMIRLPFRTPGCWQPGRSLLSSFSVTTRYLLWVHHFTVSWAAPGDPDAGAIMAQVPKPTCR